MGEDLRSKKLLWLAVLGILALLAAPWVLRLRQERDVRGIAGPREKLSTLLPPEVAAEAGVGGGGLEDEGADAEPVPEDESRPHPVDLNHLREQLPGNLYWRIGAPTKDPHVLRQREEEERHWHLLNGKVLSSTATEEEILTYYDHRRQVSEDFMAFATLVLREYGERLPEPERGLYELSLRMHRTRLEELPAQIEDALARKRLQDQRRAAWNPPIPP